MLKLYIGVDPGASGALAALTEDRRIESIIDMPMIKKGLVDGAAVARWVGEVRSAYRTDRIVGARVEQVSAMPRQGVASSFNFGSAYGGVVSALHACKVPIDFVTPAKWKRDMKLEAAKDASMRMVAMKWPDRVEEYFKRMKDDGRAEAALIALHMRDEYAGVS